MLTWKLLLHIYLWVTELTKNYHKTYNYSYKTLGFFKKMTFDFSIALSFEKTVTDWEHYNISSLGQRLLLFNTTEDKTEFVTEVYSHPWLRSRRRRSKSWRRRRRSPAWRRCRASRGWGPPGYDPSSQAERGSSKDRPLGRLWRDRHLRHQPTHPEGWQRSSHGISQPTSKWRPEVVSNALTNLGSILTKFVLS